MRFTLRVWATIKGWLGLHDLSLTEWQAYDTVKNWWSLTIHGRITHRKAIASLAMLIAWEIWNERNARVFWNHAKTNNMIVTAQIWYLKIWAKFSLFALHCIMVYIFKLLNIIKAKWKTLKREQTLPKNSKPNAIAQIGKTKYSWVSIIVQEVPRVHFQI